MSEIEKFEKPEVEQKKIDALELYQENLALHKTLRGLLVTLTRSSDWIDIEGKPYLYTTGAEAIASVLGISWSEPRLEIEDMDGGHRRYIYSAVFRWRGREIGAIGVRASNEKFFTTRKLKDGSMITLSGFEVDHPTVRMAAYTNLLHNGIMRMLGIRSLTWDDIEQYRPKQKEQSPRVEFGTITPAQQQRLWAIARECGRSAEEVRKILARHNHNSTSEIRKAEYNTIVEEIRRGEG